jgi:hypothetical protein
MSGKAGLNPSGDRWPRKGDKSRIQNPVFLETAIIMELGANNRKRGSGQAIKKVGEPLRENGRTPSSKKKKSKSWCRRSDYDRLTFEVEELMIRENWNVEVCKCRALETYKSSCITEHDDIT